MVQVFNNKNYLQQSTFDLTYLLRIRRKRWKQRKRNFFKGETISGCHQDQNVKMLLF